MAFALIYEGARVTVGSKEYDREKVAAEKAAAASRAAGKGGHARWEDEYNDFSARGRFVVSGRV